jgi:hypothetical protein
MIVLNEGIWICGFSSLGYGTVMYVWMMEHVSGILTYFT